MLVPVPVSVVSVLTGTGTKSAQVLHQHLGIGTTLVWYWYQKCTGSLTVCEYRYHSGLVPVPKVHWLSNSMWVPVSLWFGTGTKSALVLQQHVGTGTS